VRLGSGMGSAEGDIHRPRTPTPPLYRLRRPSRSGPDGCARHRRACNLGAHLLRRELTFARTHRRRALPPHRRREPPSAAPTTRRSSARGGSGSKAGGRAASPAAAAAAGSIQWLAPTPAKRWTELFFLKYGAVWGVAVLGILVPFKLYDRMGARAYLALGAAVAAPCALGPALLAPRADQDRPFFERYWVKANLWIAVFSFIGNYFWTHYFYELLGAAYTFPAHRLNGVPITLYLMTHAYFCLYHALGNVAIRGARSAAAPRGPRAQAAAEAAAVFLLAYATAFMETLTIAHFPYYTIANRDAMYRVGSLFYAIYFFVSFPAFFRMDEAPRGPRHSARRAVADALAAGMLVTCLLDFWRLGLGGIAGGSGAASAPGLVWTR
jgi:cycloeucalenol cycloisomerase